jgi:hypothetical protein
MAMTFKDKELARLETQLVELGSYKEQVLLEPTVIYNNKMKELDHFLSTGLGESMRANLERVKAEMEKSPSAFIAKEIANVDLAISRTEGELNKTADLPDTDDALDN